MISVAIDIAPEVAVACEAQDLDEMLGNLIDNAARWANGLLRVSARAGGGAVAIIIEDDGPGLADDEVSTMPRAAQQLDGPSSGYGLGLPITRELAELHGGSLALGRSALGGARATLSLPAAG
jgi:signal transduction histidine kinase